MLNLLRIRGAAGRLPLTIGRYGPAGISLAPAREKLIDAKKTVAKGTSPALEKQREKRRLTAAKTFGDMTEKWLAGARMADSTKAMRKHIIARDILPAFQNRKLNEITSGELIKATWDEVDFENAVCTISKERMKGRNPHVVYLSRQALDIFVARHTCAAGSKFVLPSRYDSDRCMSHATLNRITQTLAERAKAAEQRRHMLQEWANMIDAWIDGESYVPALMPANAVVPTLSATA